MTQGADKPGEAQAAVEEWPGGRRPPSEGLTEDEAGRRRQAGQGNDVDISTGRPTAQIVRDNVFNFINILFFALGIMLIALGRYARRRRRRRRDPRQHRRQPLPGDPRQAHPRPHRHPHAPQGHRRARRRRARRRPQPSSCWATSSYLHPGDQIVVDGRLVGAVSWRSTSRCSPASPTWSPSAPATNCSRAASASPAAATTWPSASGRQLRQQAHRAGASYRRALTPLQRQVNVIIRILLIVVIVFDVLVWVRDNVGGRPLRRDRAHVDGHRRADPQRPHPVDRARLRAGRGAHARQGHADPAGQRGRVAQQRRRALHRQDRHADHERAHRARAAAARGRRGRTRAAARRLRGEHGDANRTIEALQRPTEERVRGRATKRPSRRSASGAAWRSATVARPARTCWGRPRPSRRRLGDERRRVARSGRTPGPPSGLRVLLFAGRPEPLAFGEPGRPPSCPQARPLGLVALSDELRPHVQDDARRVRRRGRPAQDHLGRRPRDGGAARRPVCGPPTRARRPVLRGPHGRAAGAGRRRRGLRVSAHGGGRPRRRLGHDLEQLAPAAFADAAEQATVFGRVTPEQKQELVDALRDRGHYVAMVGDGVNDVIALKEAHVGVAMQSGSQAARGVADLVLLNDSFGALPYAFREGQRIINGMHDILRIFMVRIGSKALLIAIVSALGGLPAGAPASLTALVRGRRRPGRGARRLGAAWSRTQGEPLPHPGPVRRADHHPADADGGRRLPHLCPARRGPAARCDRVRDHRARPAQGADGDRRSSLRSAASCSSP